MSEHEFETLPVLALRGMTVLPGMLVNLDISRSISKKAIDEAMAANSKIFISAQKDMTVESPGFYDLFEVGVVASIRQTVKVKNNIVRVMISTEKRASLFTLTQTRPFLMGDIVNYNTDAIDISYEENEAMVRGLKDNYRVYLNENPRASRGTKEKINSTNDIETLIDLVGMSVNMSYEKRQQILESSNVRERYEIISALLLEEVQIIRIKNAYKAKVKEEMDSHQKEYFLREQMKVIKNELGDGDNDNANKYKEELEKLDCADSVKERIEKEISRLEKIPSSSAEYTVSCDYIENMLALPWNKKSEDNEDIENAENILNEDHYGLEKVKERILEFLAVRALTKKGDAPIICLVGPPGTGKTSIAKSVARALNKEYVRICLGGVRDEAEIRGHRRTYVGSLPGRFIDGLKKAKVNNPLILLDEIDKVSSDYKGDTSSALLEILDPEQNKNFVDHYIEEPVDLSNVLFICTANDAGTIPRPLMDRMETIRIAGYTENERFHIGKEYLIPKCLEKNGLLKKNLSINDAALKDMISFYTKEAGVRGLERTIEKVCRKAAREILKGDTEKVKVTKKNLSEFLGKKKYRIDMANKKDDVGIVRGLAWTQVGGDTLEIEVNTMPGKGELKITGKLGDVMKESAMIALSLVRSLLPNEDEFFKTHDFHLHVPQGAVPKDGPSAGVTITTAIYSAVTNIKVKSKVAMTGEITLRGRVLPIGGLKEKMLAAKLAGIKTVIVPVDNQPDVDEIEDEIIGDMDIVFASSFKDVWENAHGN